MDDAHVEVAATADQRTGATYSEQLRRHIEAADAALDKSQLTSPLLRTARRELAEAVRVLGRMAL